jgi:Cu+-exporting ATPase
LQLATPVVLWGAWPFHRAAWANLKHGAATMDTLISVGTLAAWLWSVYALFVGDAGVAGMKMPFDLWPDADAGADHLYLEVAAAVTVYVLAGRYFEARAKRRAGAALAALLELGAKDVAVLGADGSERRIPVEQLVVGDRFVVRPGEKVATDGVVEEGRSAVDQALLTGESVPVEKGPATRSRAPPSTSAVGSWSARRGRRRHRAGADRAAGHRRAVGQGARAAPRRPHLGRLRPRRPGARGATLGFWLGAGRARRSRSRPRSPC